MSDDRADFIRQCRNLLLSNLGLIYPNSIRGERLFRSILGVSPIYTRRDCARDLYYLTEKGYVIRKSTTGKVDATLAWEDAYWLLTASGSEVANNLIDDPALEV